MDDRKIAVIVADGAGAVVLEPVEGPGSLLSWNMNSDGSLKHLLYCPHGGTLFMDGKEVFRRAVRVVVESAQRAIADAGLRHADVSLLVSASGQPAHHRRRLPAPRHPLGPHRGRHRPLREHFVRVRAHRVVRRHRSRARPPRRPPAPERLRRRNDLGERGPAVGRVSEGADETPLPLVILAAGRARRYGGCKPLAPVGPNGEAVIDLVASDALAAGFDTIVLVLGPATDRPSVTTSSTPGPGSST